MDMINKKELFESEKQEILQVNVNIENQKVRIELNTKDKQTVYEFKGANHDRG
jgi:hypothetical protein